MPHGEQHGRSKMSKLRVRKLRKLYALQKELFPNALSVRGMGIYVSTHQMAEHEQVSQNTIHAALTNKTWRE